MKGKKRISSMKTDYFLTPKQLGDAQISSNAMMLYAHFCSYEENYNPGIADFMKILKVCKNTAYNAVNELVDNNMIRESSTKGSNSKTLYELTHLRTWKNLKIYDSKKRSDHLKLATPEWVDKRDFYRLKADCPDGMVLDHIIPIKGATVSGLNVPWNIQYISKKDNGIKFNKFDGTYSNTTWQQDGCEIEPIIHGMWK